MASDQLKGLEIPITTNGYEIHYWKYNETDCYTCPDKKDPESSWVIPVCDKAIVSPYGWRLYPIPDETTGKREYKFHYGVDLDGAKSGNTDNFETIKAILAQTKLSVEIGGGIRNIETVRKYIEAGADRVILGTSAVTDAEFLKRAVSEYME